MKSNHSIFLSSLVFPMFLLSLYSSFSLHDEQSVHVFSAFSVWNFEYFQPLYLLNGNQCGSSCCRRHWEIRSHWSWYKILHSWCLSNDSNSSTKNAWNFRFCWNRCSSNILWEWTFGHHLVMFRPWVSKIRPLRVMMKTNSYTVLPAGSATQFLLLEFHRKWRISDIN